MADEPKPGTLNVPDSTPGFYADTFAIRHDGPHHFVLYAGFNVPEKPGTAVAKVKCWIPPMLLPSIIKMLQENQRRYESKYGPIPDEPPKPRPVEQPQGDEGESDGASITYIYTTPPKDEEPE